MPPTWFNMIMSNTEFVPSSSKFKIVESKSERRWKPLTLPSYALISANYHLLPALLEMTSSDTRLCQRSHLYSPRWHVAIWCLVSRVLIIRTCVFSQFCPRRGVWKDVKCPSRLLSCVAKDTSLSINTFGPPSSSLFSFLKNCYERHLWWFPTNPLLQAFYIY